MRLKSQVASFTPRYNIAPTQDAPGVVHDGENVLKMMRWGLIPPWAEDESIGNPRFDDPKCVEPAPPP